MGDTRNKPLIGWREWVEFVDFGMHVKAKIDTGARSSALHAFDISYFERRGRMYVKCFVHPDQRDTKRTVELVHPLLERRVVRDSGGKSTLRPVIETEIRVGDEDWPIELTLVRRDMMGFRMLLGRQAVRGQFLIDPGRSFLFGRRGKKKKKKKKKEKNSEKPSRKAAKSR